MLVRALVLISMLFLSSLVFADEVKTPESEQAKSDIKSKGKSTAKDAAEMEEIVVTATRTEKEVESAPGSVSVVTKADIEKRNIQTVDQAINTISGVLDRRATGLLDPIANISLRGMPGSERTLLLLDGLGINDPYSGGQKTLLGVAPENVERIEVVKGPFSSLYGGYAMGGVVNIITKMPEKREFTLKTGYGSSWNRGEGLDDLHRFYISYGDKLWDKLSLLVSYGYRGTNGYPPDFNVQSKQPPSDITGWSYTTDNQGNTRYLIGDKGERKWWDDSITFKAQYDFSKATMLSFAFMRSRNEYKFDEPHTFLKNTSGNEVWSYTGVNESSFLAGIYGWEGNNYNLRFETEISTVKVKFSIGLLDWEKSWNTTPGASATRSGGAGKISDSPLEAYNSEIQFTVPLMNRHILTLGGSYRYDWVNLKEHSLTNWQDEDSQTDLTYQSRGKDKGYAVFLQDEIMILNNLTAYVGFRQDWWKTYDGYANDVGKTGYPKNFDSHDASSFNPKAAIVYKPFENTTLRSSVGKAFRPPTVYELYRTYTGSYGSIYASNPDLKPETTTSWDAGIEQGVWKGAKAGITYFENHMADLIYSKTVSSTYWEKINAGKATSKGIEIEAEQRFEKWLRLFANFTYTNAELKENEAKPSTVGKKLLDFPERIFNVGADFEKGPFSATLIGRYVSKRYSNDENKDAVNHVFGSYDPFFVTDAKFSYKFTKFAAISLSVDNIFDRDYYYYRKAPGRSWFSELTLRF